MSALLPKITRSSALKLALLYVGLFGMAVFILFGYVRWSTTSYLRARSDRAISAEHAVLIGAYEKQGLAGVIDLIKQRVGDRTFRARVYLLTDASFNPLAGNLTTWPETLRDAKGLSDFVALEPRPESRDRPLLRATYETLPDGSHLLVGRSIDDLDEVAATINIGLALALALMVVVAAVAGVSVTRRTVRRIETVNVISREIMRSGPGKRIPVRGTGDEWDQLANNLNSMLDRIEELIFEIRQVSDNIAHDLRTPLMRVRGRLEQALRRVRDADRDQQLISDTMTGLDSVLDTFSSLLRISQIETQDRKAAFRPVDLAAIAGEVAELFGPVVEEEGGWIKLVGDRTVNVIGDRDLLFNAISSLIDNAIKHGGDKPRITLTVTGETKPALSVSDCGPGIPAEERKHVFKRFYRLERSRRTPGNGLGLSLVAAVAHLHGAAIELGDNSPGLIVEMQFPAAVDPTGGEMMAPRAAPAGLDEFIG